MEEATDWTKEQVPELRAELKRRKLPQTGVKSVLISRLNLSDEFPKTPRGRRAKYERDLEKSKRETMAKITPFLRFTQLPAEIRNYIWELSLPGPRVLVSCNYYQSEDHLSFLEKLRAPNPVALMVCQESRAVALRRYKLCFGTADVYADLPGGDILYFSSYPTHAIELLDDIWSWTERESKKRNGRIVLGEPVTKQLSASVRNDLDAVKHIALDYALWTRYDDIIYAYGNGRNGVMLRKHLSKFKSLERVSLGIDADISLYGHLHIEDPFFEKHPFDHGIPKKEEVNEHGWRDNMAYQEWKCERKEILGNCHAVRVLRQFDLLDLTPAEIENGCPQVRVVDIKHVLDVPHRLVERW